MQSTTMRGRSRSEEIVEYNLRIDRQRGRFFKLALVLVVLVPTVASSLYYGLIASNRFVSEAQYVVRGVSTQRATGVDILFRTLSLHDALPILVYPEQLTIRMQCRTICCPETPFAPWKPRCRCEESFPLRVPIGGRAFRAPGVMTASSHFMITIEIAFKSLPTARAELPN